MTSLYSHNFTLLARPPRSVFSLGDEATRAVLPDFATVEQLRLFVDRLHIYRLDSIPGFFVQLKVGASFVCALILLIILIITRRMYEKSFWILRIMTRESGRIVVPNAMLAFSSIQGVFAAVFVAFIWLYCSWFDDRSSVPSNPILWLALTWLPLVTGALWAAIGTYFAKPSTSIRPRRRSFVRRFLSHAWTINACSLFSPVFIAASVLGPAVIANRGYMRGLRMGQQWQARYAGQQDFSQDMLQDAQRVWFETIESMRLANAIFIIWTVWALMVCAFFSIASVRLVLSIRTELQKRQKTPVRLVGVVTTHVYSNDDDRGQIDAAASGAQADGNEGPRDDEKEARHVRHAVTTTTAQQHRLSALSTSASSSSHAAGARGRRRGWIPNIFMQKGAAAAASSSASRTKQMRELRKVALHVGIQSAAITPACAIMAGVALYLGVTMYGTMEQPSASGGTRFERTLSVALVAVVWTIVLFGGVTLGAIAQRSYEGVLSSSQLVGAGGGSGSHSTPSAADVASPRLSRRLSMGIGRMLGSARNGARSTNGNGDHHVMSTFFETRTRADRQPTPCHASVHSSQMPLQRQQNGGKSSNEDDVERGGGEEEDDDDDEELNLAHDGLFIEHTVVSSIKREGGGAPEPAFPPRTAAAVGWNQDRRDSQASTLFANSPAMQNGIAATATHLSPPAPPLSRSRLTSFASSTMDAADDGDDDRDNDEYFRGGAGRVRGASRRGRAGVQR